MEQNQLFIDEQWLVDINKRVNELPNAITPSEYWSKRSIYRIPTSITDLNKRAYMPQTVSIGPYHYGAEHLKAMEEHKRRALLHFLKRSNKCLQDLVEALIPVIHDLKDAYDQLDSKWQQDCNKCLEMMILDGCFVLEILRTTNEQEQSTEGSDQSLNGQDYASNDPIFSSHGRLYIVPYLKRDMLMLENQIPMLALEKLLLVQNDAALKKGKELTKLILKFFSQTISTKHLPLFNKSLHVLDVYRTSLLLEEPPHKPRPKRRAAQHHIQPGGDEMIRSATELMEAGIQIKKSRTRSIKSISFRKGILKLPHLVVDDAFESLYLNLIAFEKFHVGVGNEVTSFIFLMRNLINKDEDVSRLHSYKVMHNALGSDKAVADLFNLLSKDITLDPESNLHHVRMEVSAYCQEIQIYLRWKASFWQTYCANPWVFISVVAAILLFALTIIQVVFAVLAYVKPPKSS